MRNDLELEGIIEDYLDDKLSAQERTAFEQLCASDPQVDHRTVSHKVFLESMREYKSIANLKSQMDALHEDVDVDGLVSRYKPHSSFIVRLWKNNKSAIAVAASFVVLSLITVNSIQNNTKQAGTFEALSRDLAQIKRSQNSLIRDMNSKAQVNAAIPPASYGGTGFAISSNGYILTNYHVIKGADSVYVQNSKGLSFKVKSFYTDPVNDIAILKINDHRFENLGTLPYSLKKSSAGLGEGVYTLGYSKDDIVLGDGYVSSKSGLNGDTITYQVAIPVNPGNSGGPLLDNSGNIVGIVNGKEEKTDGAAFAVKSKYIIEALNAVPPDSLSKRIALGKQTQLQGMKRMKQVEKIQDYVFMIKVYN